MLKTDGRLLRYFLLILQLERMPSCDAGFVACETLEVADL